MSADAEIAAEDGTGTYGSIEVKSYSTSMFELLGDVWRKATDKQKLFVCALLEPETVHKTHNTSTREQHELLVHLLNRDETENLSASYLALGTDNATAPDYENNTLNAEYYRTNVTNSSNRGTELRLTTFLGAGEGNEADAIREVGVCTHDKPGEDNYLLNHSLIPPEPKSSGVALTVTVTLGFRAVSA